jgi:HK97 gp10 family phage protein
LGVATVKIEGLRELDRALAELPKATARNTIVRTLKKAAAPVRDAAQSNAPKLTGELEQDIIIGTKLTKRQSSEVRRAGKSFAEVYIGTDLSRGMFTNFGTFKDPAQMWFDRAWAGTQDEALVTIKFELGTEIEKSAARLRKKGKL